MVRNLTFPSFTDSSSLSARRKSFSRNMRTSRIPGLRVSSYGPPPDSSRIIIPGGRGQAPRGNGQQQQSRLVIPGEDRASKKASIDTSGIQGPSTSTFRPPPGFMDAENPTAQAYGPLDPDEARDALNRLRVQAGHWHELAKLLPRLAAAGYDSKAVESETGLERARQNCWVVAQQVYDSLKASGKVPPEKLARFNHEEGASQLQYMRYLPVARRPATALYIVEQNLDSAESAILERAVKEQERREGDKEGFTNSPGDCLAFKYYRDAVETKDDDSKKRLIRKGLGVAETALAKSALGKLLDGESEHENVIDLKQPNLSIVRLTGDEVEFRPIPLVGAMAETSSAAVLASVGVRQSGPYNSFTLTAESAGQEFVALPAFRSLLLARSPVALSLKDLAEESLVLRSVGAKSEDDKLRQKGPGLVVFDRNLGEEVDPAKFYVRQLSSQGCSIVEGSDLTDFKGVCGRILFVCKPPARTAEARLDSYALYSL